MSLLEAKEIVKNAINGEFSEFRDNVKQYIQQKIQNNPRFRELDSKSQKLSNLEGIFRKIQGE